MPRLRMDPWDPGYGMGFDAASLEDDEVAVADATVETADWSTGRAPRSPETDPLITFVDGVRRIELRLIGEDGDRRAPGLFGSYAVGCVEVDGHATFGRWEVGRSVVLGCGLVPERVEMAVGTCTIAFTPATDPGGDPDRPLFRLQTLMREAEAALARNLAADEGTLVLCDGPLTFFDPTQAPVVGVIKRFTRHYLDPEHTELLPRLRRGERTPVFALGTTGDEPVQRYSWYTRLTELREPWHGYAGIVRCDVGAGVGIDRAVALADTVTSVLPRFAGRSTDPRAPQNLAPVAGLETRLRHRMGDQRVIKRALTAWLIRGDGR